MKETELKPCPFCGGIPQITINKMNSKPSFMYGVLCVGDERHSVSVGYFEIVDEAITAWNRRADNEQRAD